MRQLQEDLCFNLSEHSIKHRSKKASLGLWMLLSVHLRSGFKSGPWAALVTNSPTSRVQHKRRNTKYQSHDLEWQLIPITHGLGAKKYLLTVNLMLKQPLPCAAGFLPRRHLFFLNGRIPPNTWFSFRRKPCHFLWSSRLPPTLICSLEASSAWAEIGPGN